MAKKDDKAAQDAADNTPSGVDEQQNQTGASTDAASEQTSQAGSDTKIPTTEVEAEKPVLSPIEQEAQTLMAQHDIDTIYHDPKTGYWFTSFENAMQANKNHNKYIKQ